MLRTRPLSTSTFRLTLAYLGLFSLSAAFILAIVYMASVRFMERQARETIETEIAWLVEQQHVGFRPALLQAIVEERAAAEPNRRSIYLLVSPAGHVVAGVKNRHAA